MEAGGQQPEEGGDPAPNQGNATGSGNSSTPGNQPNAGGQASEKSKPGNRKGKRERRKANKASDEKTKPSGSGDSRDHCNQGSAPTESEWQKVQRNKKRSNPRSESQAPPRKTPQAAAAGAKGPSRANPKGKASEPKGQAGTGAPRASRQSGSGGQGNFRIPKVTYADSAKGKKPNAKEMGDLSKEEADKVKAKSGVKGISLYIHSSKDKRLPITKAQHDYVYESIQTKYYHDLKSAPKGQIVKGPAILWQEYIGERGLLICLDEETISYIENHVNDISTTDPVTGEVTFYRVWREGTFGTTLVTVMLVDKLMPNELFEEFVVACNGLDGPLYNLIIKNEVNREGLRKATFGVEAGDAAKLRELKANKSLLRVGILLARFSIGKGDADKEKAETGPTGSSSGGSDGCHNAPKDDSIEVMETESPEGNQAQAEAEAKAAEAAKAEAMARAKAAEEAAKVMANL